MEFMLGMSDPYCVMRVVGGNIKKDTRTTPIIKSTLNPRWSYSCQLCVVCHIRVDCLTKCVGAVKARMWETRCWSKCGIGIGFPSAYFLVLPEWWRITCGYARDDFLGQVEIPLEESMREGHAAWYPLKDSKEHQSKRIKVGGDIHVKLQIK